MASPSPDKDSSLTHRSATQSQPQPTLAEVTDSDGISPDRPAADAAAVAADTDDRSYPGTRVQFAGLLMFGLLFYTGVIAIALASGQYVYARYATEVGIQDAGRNTDSSQCKGASNATLDLKRRAAIAQERSARLSLYNSLAHGLPSLVSVFLLSAFSDRWGRKVSMFVPWCTTFLSFLVHVLVVLLDQPLTWQRFFGLLTGTFHLFSCNWRRAKQLGALIAACFFLFLAVLAFGVNNLYLLGLPFCWNAEKLGYFIAASSVADQIVFVVALGALRTRVSDAILVSVGLASSVAQNVVFGIAFLFQPPFDDIVLYLSRVAGLLSRLPATMLRAMLSKSVSATEQGAAFGAVACVQVFSSLFAGTATSAVYGATVASFQGFVFFMLAFWMLLSGLCVAAYSYFKGRDGNQTASAKETFEVNMGFEGPEDGDKVAA